MDIAEFIAGVDRAGTKQPTPAGFGDFIAGLYEEAAAA